VALKCQFKLLIPQQKEIIFNEIREQYSQEIDIKAGNSIDGAVFPDKIVIFRCFMLK